MPAAKCQYTLSEEQKQHWLKHGFIKVPQCFTREAAAEFTSSVWTRLGISPTDKSTWVEEKVNMPGHTMISVEEFAPKAWHAICELVGGADRIVDWCKDWKDGWIVNMGKPEYSPEDDLDLRSLDNWHNDGDWFIHFLDSPEQALLVIPLFSDIKPKGGGTAICTDGIGLVADHLYNHPEGTWPSLISRNAPNIPTEETHCWKRWANSSTYTKDESFHEATGEVGDVFLLHPFMLHSASRNLRRDIRIITNPPVALKEPFNFNRADGRYSLVEQKTLRDLGRPKGLPEWKTTGSRELLAPNRIEIQSKMAREELERIEKAGEPITTLAGVKPVEYYPS
ncbi:hypothetical protein N7474_011003 [Penicillium riverlandense]|uniref:uncharacterized protein n=1 Tax=Penicillium riverlandense TaxID=1903569 RepID=UPI002546C030|nr:uncharacterized protein N7474_011003 [Penicillium riverlandense]KAJ5805116.1 hypothetical protein N7474_011003 [Penicillium riverlandense]